MASKIYSKGLKCSFLLVLSLFLISAVSALSLDFGGMYSLGVPGTANAGKCFYENPATSNCTCPSGYSSKITWGSKPTSIFNGDKQIFYCYKFHDDNKPGMYDFGGMYSPKGSAYNGYVNPVTGNRTCPEGYNEAQITGTVNVDYKSFYCYKEYKGEFKFGGMIGTGISDEYNNSITLKSECSGEFNKYQILGFPTRADVGDYKLFYCGNFSATTIPPEDNDHDGVPANEDCNDNNASVWQILKGYRDVDGDGLGKPGLLDVCSGTNLPSGYVSADSDCNDNDASAWHNLTGYKDNDSDGFGRPGVLTVCSGINLPGGYSLIDSDCNDDNASIYPGHGCETNNDNDGDGVPAGLDCNDSNSNVWQNLLGFVDKDGDTYGKTGQMQICSGINLPAGFVGRDSDCNDDNASIYPGHGCSGDNDNDGVPIENDCDDFNPNIWQMLNGYRDNDGDGFGSPLLMGVCSGNSLPNGYVPIDSDCDDTNPNVHPGAGCEAPFPGSVTNLSAVPSFNWIYWTWDAPENVSKSIIYLNGVNVANTTHEFYNSTGLNEDTWYTITIHTIDSLGNINNTDSIYTVKTLKHEEENNNHHTSNGNSNADRIVDDVTFSQPLVFTGKAVSNESSRISLTNNDNNIKEKSQWSWFTILLLGLLVVGILALIILIFTLG